MRYALALILSVAASSAAAQGANVLLNCSSCHTVGPPRQDAVRAPSPYPNLNGQPARYLERQLHAYRMGLRQHPQMQATATALGEGAGAMARLYADARPPELSAPPENGEFEDAVTLVTEGDWSRGLPSCDSCHALEEAERGRLMPRLHGHPAPYLARQLRAYADGSRQSDTMGRMRGYAAQLSETEITELSEYYSAFAADGRNAEGNMSVAAEREETPDG